MSNLYFSFVQLGVRLITLMRQLIDLMISIEIKRFRCTTTAHRRRWKHGY